MLVTDAASRAEDLSRARDVQQDQRHRPQLLMLPAHQFLYSGTAF